MKKRLLTSVAALALTLGACTMGQIQTATTTVENDIQQGVAIACQIVPTLPAITSVIGVLFPQISAITEIGLEGEQLVISKICQAAPSQASAKYRALPTQNGAPAVIGSVAGVPIVGWRAR